LSDHLLSAASTKFLHAEPVEDIVMCMVQIVENPGQRIVATYSKIGEFCGLTP